MKTILQSSNNDSLSAKAYIWPCSALCNHSKSLLKQFTVSQEEQGGGCRPHGGFRYISALKTVMQNSRYTKQYHLLLFQLGKHLANIIQTSVCPFPLSKKLVAFLTRLMGKDCHQPPAHTTEVKVVVQRKSNVQENCPPWHTSCCLLTTS